MLGLAGASTKCRAHAGQQPVQIELTPLGVSYSGQCRQLVHGGYRLPGESAVQRGGSVVSQRGAQRRERNAQVRDDMRKALSNLRDEIARDGRSCQFDIIEIVDTIDMVTHGLHDSKSRQSQLSSRQREARMRPEEHPWS